MCAARAKSSSPTTPVAALDPAVAQKFRKSLKARYARYGRNLPWRETQDPYHCWISEIMLQQTTVVAVVPYFDRFLTRFPTVHELAAAEEAEVMRYWEGLGYYSRARNIHKAAKHVSAELNGAFPNLVDKLQELPGIGRYTAGAIRSFAFDLPAPIVEANTLRLYCRLLGFDGDPRAREGQNRLWSFAEELVPANQPGKFNQALMELGAVVCTPTNPKCSECPVSFACQAFVTGRQTEIPLPAVRPVVTAVTELSAIVRRAGQYLVYHRAHGERWAGLWDFPRFPLDESLVKALKRHPASLEKILAERLGIQIVAGDLLTEICHSVTRYRITLRAFQCEHLTGEISESVGEYRWLDADEVHALPLSVTGRKLAKLLK
ncbi:MAG: A/G-specific adenine glycosylase [Planctomycetaceae bacterium]|nr:A/G-specific adenine glycosylase [Planctomycetaceae bacterium]